MRVLRRFASKRLVHKHDSVLPSIALPLPRPTAYYYTQDSDFAALEEAVGQPVHFVFPKGINKATKIAEFMMARDQA